MKSETQADRMTIATAIAEHFDKYYSHLPVQEGFAKLLADCADEETKRESRN